jgi:hypothetical protein
VLVAFVCVRVDSVAYISHGESVEQVVLVNSSSCSIACREIDVQ